MILECSNCGAPLDVKEGVRRTRCHYCGQTTEAEKLGKVAEKTPEDWVPPQNWTPPEHSRLAGKSLVYRPVRMIGRAISTAITLGVLGIGASVVLHVTRAVNQVTNAQSAEFQGAINKAIGAVTNQINAAAQTGSVAGDGPIECSGADNVVLTGKTLRVEGAAVPVTASGNCRVKLVACRLTGSTAIVARDNARISVEGGALIGVKAAVSLSGNAALDVSGGTMLTGGPAVAASGNARATLRDASVNGAVETRENASVDAVGSKLLGPVTGTRRVRK
jgi:hypothetical protein